MSKPATEANVLRPAVAEHTLGYREVVTDQLLHENWIDINLTTGASQSTLQDIKATEVAHGYSYKDGRIVHLKNRFIYWRIDGDVLELTEQSLELDLTGNKLRYRFTNSPILDGVSICETNDNVIILVPTVCSVHRLIFPHPNLYHRFNDTLTTAPSIFTQANVNEARHPNNCYVFTNPNATSDSLPSLGRSFYNSETQEAVFVLLYPVDDLLLVKLTRDSPISIELKAEINVPRFFHGLKEKFKTKSTDGQHIVDIFVDSFSAETLIIALSRNGLLRFWSPQTGQNIHTINLLAETKYIMESIQNATMRKSFDIVSNDCFIMHARDSTEPGHLFIIEVKFGTEDTIEISIVRTISCNQHDLLDLGQHSDRIWAAWRTSDEDCAIYTTSVQSTVWMPIVKEPMPGLQVPQNPVSCDPRQYYLQHLFHPGRFPLHILNKALGIYRKSNLIGTEINLTSISSLKQAICMAIESDIHATLINGDVTEEQYLEYAQWSWKKFYSCCIQYYQASSRPLGFVILPQSGGALLLKRATISFVRPLDPLEHLHMLWTYHENCTNFAVVDEGVLKDIVVVFDTLAYIEQQLSDLFRQDFEDLCQIGLLTPEESMTKLMKQLKSQMSVEYEEICNMIIQKLRACSNLFETYGKILDLLRNDPLYFENYSHHGDVTRQPFGSILGINLLASSIRQQCHTRFNICRGMLAMTVFLSESNRLVNAAGKSILSICMPELSFLTSSHYLLHWFTQLPPLDNVHRETTLQRISFLQFTPASPSRPGNVFSILELFLLSMKARSVSEIPMVNNMWKDTLMPVLAKLRHLIWPLHRGTIVQEWLISQGQHIWLEHYVRLVTEWTEHNLSSNHFFQGIAHLCAGDKYKAFELFKKAAAGVDTEPLLIHLAGDQKLIGYYMRVIQLFEAHKAIDCAIKIVNKSLAIAIKEPEFNVNISTLYSMKFRHLLEMERYKDAFDVLKLNPERERRRDGLREMVKLLLDNNLLKTLVEFNYGDLDDMFNNILLVRARSQDALDNIFYDLIYIYQMNQGQGSSYRLAAAAFYEQAYRLSQRVDLPALEKYVKCCLAAENLLKILGPKDGWLIRPFITAEENALIEIVVDSQAGSGKDPEVYRLHQKPDIVDLRRLRQHLLFGMARLKLATINMDIIVNVRTPKEMIETLSEAGLFKLGIKLAEAHNMSLDSTFESLTGRCIALMEQDNGDAWLWLAENDLQDLPPTRDNAATIAWALLQMYLNRYEQPGSSELHRAIISRMISGNIFIPLWIMQSYIRRNPAQLLKLLYDAGRLEEATAMTKQYILASYGFGREEFGIDAVLSPVTPPLRLPVYMMTALVKELEMHQKEEPNNPLFTTEMELLKDLVDSYIKNAVRISNATCSRLLSSHGNLMDSIDNKN